MSLTQKKIKHLAHSFMEENFESLPRITWWRLEETMVDFVKKVEGEIRYEDMRGPIHITRVG